jgi:hypothetical protein
MLRIVSLAIALMLQAVPIAYAVSLHMGPGRALLFEFGRNGGGGGGGCLQGKLQYNSNCNTIFYTGIVQ